MAFSRLLIVALFVTATLGGAPWALAQATEQIRSAQQRLNELGDKPGPVDGLIDARTRQALTAFQTQRGLPANGELDTRTLQALAARPAAAAAQPVQVSPQSAPSSDSTVWWWVAGGLVLFALLRLKARRHALLDLLDDVEPELAAGQLAWVRAVTLGAFT